jgi:hypothetical protein
MPTSPYDSHWGVGNLVSDTVMVGLKLLEFILPAKLEKTIFG